MGMMSISEKISAFFTLSGFRKDRSNAGSPKNNKEDNNN